MILITSYNRPEMLLTLLKSLKGEKVVVVDDGSTYSPIEHMKYCDYYRTEHKGKPGFWVLWDLMFEIAEESKEEWFLFTQDDVSNIQVDKIRKATEGLGQFAFNIMRRGGERYWTAKARKDMKEVNIGGIECIDGSYVDCNFATNRFTLNRLGWRMNPVPIRRFMVNNISSGVGQQLSQRLYEKKIPMYIPKKSLAYHGRHPSLMHPDERIKNPLVSK